MLLNVRTAYSLLQSTLRISQYVEYAAQQGYQALGIADSGSLQGALEFYNACQSHGVKPMIGLCVHISGYLRQDREFPFLLYAKNLTGFQELSQIVRLLSRVDHSPSEVWQLIATCQHIVYLTAGHSSELEQLILHHEEAQALELLQALHSMFGMDNVYLGLSGYPVNPIELELLREFSSSHQIPLVMGQLVTTLKQEDQFSLMVMQAIAANELIDWQLSEVQGMHYVYPYDTLCHYYQVAGLSDCIIETQQLVERLNVELPQHQAFLPKFNTPHNLSATSYLQQLTQVRLEELALDPAVKVQYQERLDYELSVIGAMGFSDYFLIVWDIVAYCRSQQIRVGPGRGSAAGSLVSYLLRITSVDPIAYQLLFERFLNPERYNMPDIDLDIPDNKRQQVLQYVVQRYGHEQVAQIATLGTFGARQAIRDILRVLGADRDVLRQWAAVIPKELDVNLTKAYQKSVGLRQLVEQNPQNRQIFRVALTLEGLPRHISTHAAAVVIHDQPLIEVVPVVERPHQPLMTQYTMYDVERIGLLKMDFLGLRNLSLLDAIIKTVRQTQPDFQIENISMSDAATLGLFCRAETNGIFQFESDGIKQVLRKLQPERFEDIVAVNALFRPGPMKQIDHYVARRHGRETFSYLHPLLESILAPTYGIIVYQEQVMQVCQMMAGFSLGQADLLRRAMGKKQADVMANEREHFVAGAQKNGIERETSEAVYQYIYEFASYGFNRSHAVVYSTLAYQLAYLKAHYPLAFYQGLLNAGSSNKTTILEYVQEASRVTGGLLGLDINQSQLHYSAEKTQLRVGFDAIKGVRQEFLQHILNDRQLLGPYRDVVHFMQRLPQKWLKQEWLEILIKVGAFDFTGVNRPTQLHNLAKQMQSVTFSGGNLNLFPEMTELKIQWQPDWSPIEQAQQEQAILGFSLGGHPVGKYQRVIDQSPSLIHLHELVHQPLKRRYQTIALVQSIRVITTKRQELMAFLELADEVTTLSAVVFPEEYRRFHNLIKEQSMLQLSGQLEHDRQGRAQLVVKQVEAASQEVQTGPIVRRCFIQVDSFDQFAAELPKLKSFAQQHAGPVQLVLVNQQREVVQLESIYNIGYADSIRQAMHRLLPHYKIVFK